MKPYSPFYDKGKCCGFPMYYHTDGDYVIAVCNQCGRIVRTRSRAV